MHEVDTFAIVKNLEMLLDQLSYWARRAEQPRSSAGDPGLEGRMLALATAKLESFVTALLDCYRPLELVPTRMSTSDLVSAIVMRARGDHGAARVTVTGGADSVLSVDAARLTRALSAILQRLDLPGAPLHVEVVGAERGGRRGVEIVLGSEARSRSGGPRYEIAELEWALACRIVAMHAGAVEERPGPGGHTVVLFLPAGL